VGLFVVNIPVEGFKWKINPEKHERRKREGEV
jgi:hypothetical protein